GDARGITHRVISSHLHRPPLQLYAMTNGLPPDMKPQPRNMPRTIDLLETTKWADDLSRKEVEVLAGYFRLYTAEKGSVIVREGSRDVYLCLLLDGKVQVTKELCSGSYAEGEDKYGAATGNRTRCTRSGRFKCAISLPARCC